MRASLRLLSVLVLLTTLALVANAEDKKTKDGKPLFNGKDFSGWKFFLKDKDADPAKTWSVVDDYVRCTGVPRGYFYTDKPYENYVLHYEWRYPAGSKPDSNSGCLVHMQLPHEIWPKCVEPQGRYRDHGKLFFTKVKPIEQKFDEKAQKKALQPIGEWGATEITCKADGSISVKLNGVPVSSGKSELTAGPIGFQSEDAEIHFRNIRIKELK